MLGSMERCGVWDSGTLNIRHMTTRDGLVWSTEYPFFFGLLFLSFPVLTYIPSGGGAFSFFFFFFLSFGRQEIPPMAGLQDEDW
jgi:hypothetical protein